MDICKPSYYKTDDKAHERGERYLKKPS